MLLGWFISVSQTWQPRPADKHQPFNSLLHGAELHPDNELRLRRHVLEDVSLQPPEHVRAQQVVELLNLVLLGDVGKLLQEALQVAAQITIEEEELTAGVWRLS